MKSRSRLKTAALSAVMLLAMVLALPTFYGDDPALQVESAGRAPLAVSDVETALRQAGIKDARAALERGTVVVRFDDVDEQLQARDALRDALPDHTVALAFAPRMPGWLQAASLRPVNLGLDLRGGVHFLYQVDLEAALQPLLESYQSELRNRLRTAGVRASVGIEDGAIVVRAAEATAASAVEGAVQALVREARNHAGLGLGTAGPIEAFPLQAHDSAGYRLTLSEAAKEARREAALEQNVMTLRNRVDELGVAQPVVQSQGRNRIVVELPGVQDAAQAARLLGVAATLQFRLVDTNGLTDARAAALGARVYPQRDGSPIALSNSVIASGDQLLSATSGYAEGEPAVFVTLDPQGARRMLETTQRNVGRRMAVLFITQTPELTGTGDAQEWSTRTEETVIVAPVIRSVLSSRFQITGLTPREAQDLALLLRSGSLAAPMVLERDGTIGPSLGQDNIAKGRLAIVVGLLAVAAFMAGYYRLFGMVANLALVANLVLMVALLALLGASLTLPGIAGIVLTLGMAVDANVLIFERIREELRRGSSARASIAAGYGKAFSSIADANVTTLIAALVLLSFGSGPVKGFAVTLSIGIMTSMLTAIYGTRIIVDLIYGERKVRRLSIGGRSLAGAAPS